jgi:histidinol phosphatase-like PHP family hydrolase
MTKIDQINDAVTVQSAKKPTTSTGSPFSASLENALSQKSQETTGSEQTSALREPQPSIMNPSGTTSTHMIGQTDKLLGLLESYATGLENPSATLKELASIVSMMKDEAMQLMASTDAHAVEESGLNGIAAKAALTANVEYIKFQRGDYI